MTALVVYESMFGNTKAVAAAIAEGLGSALAVDLVDVADAPTVLEPDVRLLVVGGPTHAFGLSRPATRQSAANQLNDGAVPASVGLREWLRRLQRGAANVATTAFDTRVRKPLLPGSAAKAAARRLRRLGFSRLARPASFYVAGTPGPLVPGELERATRWGGTLGGKLS